VDDVVEIEEMIFIEGVDAKSPRTGLHGESTSVFDGGEIRGVLDFDVGLLIWSKEIWTFGFGY
jgi:hypothetical protein